VRLDRDDRADELPRGQPLKLSYVVRVAFDDPASVAAYLPWLRRHVVDVCHAGAERAEIVLVDGHAAVEVRYAFSSRAAFERYEIEEAPRLRKEGLAEIERLGEKATFSRWTGEVVVADAQEEERHA
jgi:hypothetical protein